MAGNYLETVGIKLRYLLGTSKVSDIDEGFQVLAEDVAAKVLGWSEDTLAKRPAAGVRNRMFRATDTGVIYKDTGTGWDAIEWPGQLRPSASASPLEGWLLCDGKPYSRTEYALLFAAIGEAYGAGDKSTTFNVPDLRERVMLGVGGAYTRGLKGGEASVVLTPGQLASHNHGGNTGYESNAHVHGFGVTAIFAQAGGGAGLYPGGSEGGGFSQTQTESANHYHAIGAEGGNQAHNNLQPYQACNVFIKT